MHDPQPHSPVLPDDDDWVPISAVPERVPPWLAALQSAGIPCESLEDAAGAVIRVPPERLARALAELRTYERVNDGWPPPPVPPAEDIAPGAVIWSLFLALLLFAFHLVTGPATNAGEFFTNGVLDVGRVFEGEWWRVITALTLHADMAHVAANSAALIALGIATSQQLGPGLGWALGFAGGIGGNALEAWLAQPGRRSLGASTSVFAFLAILAALRFVSIWQHEGRPRTVWARSWLPLFAALGALSFLGTSRGSDVAGHGLGFAAGLVLGLVVGVLPRRRPNDAWQLLLCVVPVAVVAWAWHLALASAGS
ncbi:MAG: rhomboid family intramembrane serine protease [Victivallales bacterium]|nr:rhomboid family intramembrane serine protease [Victivallales bacterium]MBT7162978.1 rhomboid family intramembrane serine protease [Victivallales bacterium]